MMRPGLILEVARRAGLEPKRITEHESAVRCPQYHLHRNGDEHPSCRLNAEKNTYYCHPCGEGGGIKKFAEALGVDLRCLPESFGRQSGNRSSRSTPKTSLCFTPSRPIRKVTQQFLGEKIGKAYHPETWQAFGVLEGSVWPEGKPEKAEPCIAFPQPDSGFHVYRYRRKLKAERWRFPKGSRPNLITVGFDRPDPVVLAEGEWDAMTAYELGFPVATGTGGCAHWDATRFAEPFQARLVAAVYDADKPGRAGVLKPLQALPGVAQAITEVSLPISGKDGKDLTDFVRLHGHEAFRQLITASIERLKANGGCACVAPSPSAAEILSRMEMRFPGTRGVLHACLALHGYLCFSGAIRPCALFIVGAGSSGKTLVLRMFLPLPGESGLDPFIYRCDSFTPASFVSRAANIKPERLSEIDLLPKLENKVLITKELAPVFRGKDEDLTQTFAILTSILDGDGYMVAGGSVGTRGYSDDIFFCWLGATTPFSPRTWRTMASLGPRILFYATVAQEPSIEDLVKCQEEDSQEEQAMRLEMNLFLKHFFGTHPPRSVPLKHVECSKAAAKVIANYARFIARLRAGLSLRESDDKTPAEARYAPPEKEHEFRLAKTLNVLARGSALVLGRRVVTDEDLVLLQHIASSSAPEVRRKVAVALIELTRERATAGGRWPFEIPLREVASRSGASLPTVRHYAEELHVLKVGRFIKVGVGDQDGSTLSLVDDLAEIIAAPHTHNPNSLSTSPPQSPETGDVRRYPSCSPKGVDSSRRDGKEP